VSKDNYSKKGCTEYRKKKRLDSEQERLDGEQ
jgi:hypothetical protein